MFLKTNETKILKQMKQNPNNISKPLQKIQKTKMTDLLKQMIPNVPREQAQFLNLEKWVGHDLLVTSIMTLSKVTRENKVFATVIPPLQWKAFEDKQRRMNRQLPDKNDYFPKHMPKPPPEKKSAPAGTEKKKKKKKGKKLSLKGKLFFRFGNLFLLNIQLIYVFSNITESVAPPRSGLSLVRR
jgi:hypothetical protein